MAETKIEVEVVAEGNPAPHPSDMVSIVGESEFFPAISTFIEPTDDQVNKSYADVLSEVVRQRSLLKSDLLAKKLRWGLGKTLQKAPLPSCEQIRRVGCLLDSYSNNRTFLLIILIVLHDPAPAHVFVYCPCSTSSGGRHSQACGHCSGPAS